MSMFAFRLVVTMGPFTYLVSIVQACCLKAASMDLATYIFCNGLEPSYGYYSE